MKRTLMIAGVVAILVSAVAQIGDAQAGGRLSKRELHSLVMNAKTSGEHLKVAAHYKSEAERLQAEAKEHEEMAEMYRKNPHPLEAKEPWGVGQQHCRDIAARYREAADKMQRLAILHENMAKKVGP